MIALDQCRDCGHMESAHVAAGTEDNGFSVTFWDAHCRQGCKCTAFVATEIPALTDLGPAGLAFLDAVMQHGDHDLCCSMPCPSDLRMIAGWLDKAEVV